jgi:hypothetical protein
MIESVPYKQIKQQANEYDNQLACTDPRFLRSVHVVHQDGSVFFFRHAFLMWKDNWVIVFSEHHGVHVYDQDDVETDEFQPHHLSQEHLP